MVLTIFYYIVDLNYYSNFNKLAYYLHFLVFTTINSLITNKYFEFFFCLLAMNLLYFVRKNIYILTNIYK